MDDLSELQRLRARVAELEAERDSAAPGPVETRGPQSARWAPVSAGLIVVACVLAPAAVASTWVATIVSDTDRYVETVAPLIEDPAIQASLADAVTEAVVEGMELEELTAGLLETIADGPDVPPRLSAALPGLATPITDGVESFTRDQVERVVASPRFAQVWAEVNRVAHDQVVALLSGEQGGAVGAQGDTITLNLAPVVAAVKARLLERGFGPAATIPVVDRSFVLAQSDAIAQAQSLYRLLDTLGVWLPVVVLVLLAGGIALARDRRRALLRAALGLVVAMVVLGVALIAIGTWYVATTPGDVLSSAAAEGFFDTLVSRLRTSLRALAVAGLVTALGALLAGPGTLAVRTRATVSGGLGSARREAASAGWDTGRFGTWVFAHRRTLRVAAPVLGGLVLVFSSRPTAWTVIWVAVAVVLVLVLVELLGRPPSLEEAGTGPADTPPAVAGEPVPVSPRDPDDTPRSTDPDPEPSARRPKPSPAEP